MNFNNLDTRDVTVCLSFSIRVLTDSDVVVASENERWTRYFAITFKVVLSQDPNNIEIRVHINFWS